MENMSSARVRLTADEARELSRQSLAGLGYTPVESQVLAEHMLDAAFCGYEYSGLPKILNVAEQLERRPAPTPMRVIHETPVSARLHGGGQNGMLTLHRASEIAIEKAVAGGFAVVGVNHTWMSGRGSYYVEMLANAGLIGIHTVSSRPQVAPPGGARAAIGTNPISFGFPTEGAPFVIDLGTSALMFTDLALRARRGETLPEGVAIDANGEPTQDPILASMGAVLPFGGHKGFALGLAMQALGILAGSGDDNEERAGYLIIAIRPDLMVPLNEYRRTLSETLARIKATPLQPGVESIRLPSERSQQERERNQRTGIVIDRQVQVALQRLARGNNEHARSLI
ncbi:MULTISPECIES: Ldh family oxidoreductase [unclassified Pigmentiphaga]|uniref:Ldh family oxidoreductase n=1 Tax=unclassified Pigmentiphaga TaxID=2626614 RepID=UPI00140491CD|nr:MULTISPECIES: Ldh family oxidoreductase [unclassified Pigmentiphaga]